MTAGHSRRETDAGAYRKALAAAVAPARALLDAIRGAPLDSAGMEAAALAARQACDRLREAAAHLNEHQ